MVNRVSGFGQYNGVKDRISSWSNPDLIRNAHADAVKWIAETANRN